MILAIYNPKGGCAKTTTAVNLATDLARRGRAVLLVDLEADMGASISVGVGPGATHPSIFELLLHQCRPADAVQRIDGVPNLHLVAGSPGLAGITTALRNVRQPERRLADCIRPLAASVDDVIIDCPSNFTVTVARRNHACAASARPDSRRLSVARIAGPLAAMVPRSQRGDSGDGAHCRHRADDGRSQARSHARDHRHHPLAQSPRRPSDRNSGGSARIGSAVTRRPTDAVARSRAARAYERLTTEVVQRVERIRRASRRR